VGVLVAVAVGGMGVIVLVGIGVDEGASVGRIVDVGADCVVAQAVTSNSATSRKTMFFIVFPSIKNKTQPRLRSGTMTDGISSRLDARV
ncbi:MAG: hypothetical protein ACERKY_13955, partial [Anaerolineales bacterium]